MKTEQQTEQEQQGSQVIHHWMVPVQAAMPDEMRNGREWKDALAGILDTDLDPAAERARLAMILDWMWHTVLPEVQSTAGRYGFWEEWTELLQAHTAVAASEAVIATRTAAERVALMRSARSARAVEAAALAELVTIRGNP